MALLYHGGKPLSTLDGGGFSCYDAADRFLKTKKHGEAIDMIREIMRDEAFLKQPSAPATPEDVFVADDLLDTLRAHRAHCVGMAANMIGVSRRVIVFDDAGKLCEMFNPVILKRETPYEAEEGCLSLVGTRKARRYKAIKVQWQTREFKPRIRTFTGFTAQIIQHEMDHLEGTII